MSIKNYIKIKLMEDFSEKIQSLRNEYSDLDLTAYDLNQNPITQFTKWLDEAIETKIYEPNAMVLATVDGNAPRSRFVLFKNIVDDNLIFHTHYESPKAKGKTQKKRKEGKTLKIGRAHV